MSSNLLQLITGEREDGLSIDIEFGDNCCIIVISNEETDEIYWYWDPKEPNEPLDLYANTADLCANIVDLYANSYHKNLLCYDVNSLLKIIRKFVDRGEPHPDFQWFIDDHWKLDI